MLRLIKVYNATYEEEECLYDLTNDRVLLEGDYYHDKISYKIDAYIKALEDFEIDFELEDYEGLLPSNPLFEIIGFYNDED